MKKILLTVTLLGSTLSSMSQQLPNNGFESDWVKFVPYTGGKYNKESEGLTPESWTIANVIGAKVGTSFKGATKVGEEITGHNSTKAVKLYNNQNSYAKSQIVPGYITLGTPWNTAKGATASNKDGGTFGGISFEYKPDALHFWYKRSCSGTNTQSSVIAYLWNGTVTQTNVPVTTEALSSPKKVNMDDRDIWILRKNVSCEGDAVTNNPTKLIAHIESYITNTTEDWVEQTYKFIYDPTNKNETPTKFNIIFAASDYFNKKVTDGVSLSIDDVTLVYYKHLSKLTINGKTPANFVGDESANNSDKVTIDATDTEYTDGCVVAEAAGAGATITKASYNPLTAKYEIVVTAADDATKTYEIQFKKDVYNKQVYENSLLVHYDEYYPITKNKITLLSHKEKEKFGFVLENFEFGDMGDMGMIYVKDLAKKVNTDNSITYSNTTPEMVYIEGLMGEVPVTVNATVKDNQMTATIKIPLDENDPKNLVTVTYGPQLTINPAQSLETTNSTGITNVVMTRTFKAGWNTYCMPFDYNVADLGTDVKVQEFVSADNNGLNFAAISDGVLKANNPYLVFFPTETAKGTTDGPVYFATTVNSYNPTSVTYGAYTFSGNYTANMNMSGKYGVANFNGVQKLRIGGASATLPAGCAYFTTANNANGMLIRFDGGNTTGILDVNTGVVVENTAVYNLQGVKVSNNGTAGLPAGIYVMGGKKVIVK